MEIEPSTLALTKMATVPHPRTRRDGSLPCHKGTAHTHPSPGGRPVPQPGGRLPLGSLRPRPGRVPGYHERPASCLTHLPSHPTIPRASPPGLESHLRFPVTTHGENHMGIVYWAAMHPKRGNRSRICRLGPRSRRIHIRKGSQRLRKARKGSGRGPGWVKPKGRFGADFSRLLRFLYLPRRPTIHNGSGGVWGWTLDPRPPEPGLPESGGVIPARAGFRHPFGGNGSLLWVLSETRIGDNPLTRFGDSGHKLRRLSTASGVYRSRVAPGPPVRPAVDHSGSCARGSQRQ